jgi:Rieske Fe-S protein
MTRYDDAAGAIACPCHGSRFDKQGQVTGGPAPRPLDRMQMTLEGGQLVVDSSKLVEPSFVLEA